MADRDALIVICWLVILILVFFECFHRKLKARFGRDIQPPATHRQSLSSFPSDAATVGGSSSLSNGHFGGSFRRGDFLPSNLGSTMSFNSFSRGARFSGPIAITTSTSTSSDDAACSSTKEVCRIPMMSMMMMSYDNVEEEEPPPTYEEAISYAKLISKFQSPAASPSPSYEDTSVILQCDDDSANSDTDTEPQIVRDNQSKNVNANQSGGDADNNAINHGVATTSANRTTTTTAIFINEEDDDDESEIYSEESDDSSSVESANNSADEDEHGQVDLDSNNNNNDEDNETTSESQLISKHNVINSQELNSDEMQCNRNVILGSASSTSKNLDRLGTRSIKEKTQLSFSDNANTTNGDKPLFLDPSSRPPKLVPPPSLPGNLV